MTLGNADGAIGGLTISDPPTQAEVQALRDRCEGLADDVRVLATLVQALRAALITAGLIKGGAQVVGGIFLLINEQWSYIQRQFGSL